jgi:hypothetical protein
MVSTVKRLLLMLQLLSWAVVTTVTDGWMSVDIETRVNLELFRNGVGFALFSDSQVTYASGRLQGQWTLKRRLEDSLPPTRRQE